MKSKTLKLLEENIGCNYYLSIEEETFIQKQKTRATKKKHNKSDSAKIQNLVSKKDRIKLKKQIKTHSLG